MREITADELIAKVRDLAERFPERTEECFYVQHDDQGNLIPQCIIGCALVEAGVEPESLENEPASFDYMYPRHGVVTDDYDNADHSDKIAWLTEVQGEQDSGQTWENAVRYADTVYPLAPV